jgi:hypothetical protein
LKELSGDRKHEELRIPCFLWQSPLPAVLGCGYWGSRQWAILKISNSGQHKLPHLGVPRFPCGRILRESSRCKF